MNARDRRRETRKNRLPLWARGDELLALAPDARLVAQLQRGRDGIGWNGQLAGFRIALAERDRAPFCLTREAAILGAKALAAQRVVHAALIAANPFMMTDAELAQARGAS